MARIRSIHPGQWSVGSFVACSALARLLCLAVRNHADDRGVFRWKPLDLKMVCLPGDNCDIDKLLSELVENGQLVKYEHAGKSYGLVPEFTQWQRPKKPTITHPIPEPVRNQFGIDHAPCDPTSEPPPSKTDDSSEISPQREEVGGREEEHTSGVCSSSNNSDSENYSPRGNSEEKKERGSAPSSPGAALPDGAHPSPSTSEAKGDRRNVHSLLDTPAMRRADAKLGRIS